MSVRGKSETCEREVSEERGHIENSRRKMRRREKRQGDAEASNSQYRTTGHASPFYRPQIWISYNQQKNNDGNQVGERRIQGSQHLDLAESQTSPLKARLCGGDPLGEAGEGLFEGSWRGIASLHSARRGCQVSQMSNAGEKLVRMLPSTAKASP